jgi:thiol-disulfide isomerase/thioredoxin
MNEALLAAHSRVDRRTQEQPQPVEPNRSAALRGILPRLGCAVILIIAATLKTHQLIANPGLGALYGSRWLQVGLIEYECIVAVWLMSGFRPTWCRGVSLITFAGFGCYSLYLALSGTTSCGCFGQVHVNPWWAFTLDGVLVLLLWQWNPYFVTGSSWRFGAGLAYLGRMPTLFRVAAGLTVLGVPIVAITGWGRGTAATDAESLANQELVVLEPEQWIGKRFPLFEYIDIGEHLATGSWVLVFYHSDCAKCQEATPKYERLAEELKEAGDAVQVALIEVPPYGTMELVANRIRWRGRLTERKEWFIMTPTEVRITDGQVTTVPTKRESQ